MLGDGTHFNGRREMADKFAKFYDPVAGVTWPLDEGEAVTPSNSVNFAQPGRALWVGGAGDVAVLTTKGSTLVFSGVPAGTLIPVRAARVNSTSTTATLILNLW